MSDRALVKNAADPEQVAYGKRKEQRRGDARADLLREQLATYLGRQFVYEELERHQIFARVKLWHTEAVYEFLGRREVGLDLYWELKTAFPAAFDVMQREALQRQTKDQREVDAVHTPRADENEP